ncbi:rhodanese-like domain-containing protein [Pseudodesulfovibrio piezophilus]|uniref:Rhodanese homology domain superfamily protein n=1 Tax=Pseudodesulfovibrio piezophilus (strain DSM 21447 / JCM 15486 / C1TLV30) TaxID=1322246 RepID=M1WUX5_PSEP2|nr:rhodanese-like domain-containing protein [Pseudodesulfovibrio piezophilus]CCH47963.1 Rhodanese homology domain superfamily protein [Pseudodesulfovibrio piezophilus C1TLV30]
MKKLTLAALFLMLLPVLAWAHDYNFISQEAMKAKLDKNEAVNIVDICPIDQFAKGHLPGSVETNAYPVKTEEDRNKLQAILPDLSSSTDGIVIICPAGRGGAKRTYEYYKSQGIDESRLFILENGMNGWPYQTESK